MTLPVQRVAWRTHPNLGTRTTRGALTGSRAGWRGRPGTGGVGTERAGRLGRWQEGSTWDRAALCRCRTAGQGRKGTLGPFHRRPRCKFENWGQGRQRALGGGLEGLKRAVGGRMQRSRRTETAEGVGETHRGLGRRAGRRGFFRAGPHRWTEVSFNSGQATRDPALLGFGGSINVLDRGLVSGCRQLRP